MTQLPPRNSSPRHISPSTNSPQAVQALGLIITDLNTFFAGNMSEIAKYSPPDPVVVTTNTSGQFLVSQSMVSQIRQIAENANNTDGVGAPYTVHTIAGRGDL